MSEVPGNTERFTGRVGEYARFRSAYPARALIGFLEEACQLTATWRVADVAAGTGMLTEVFLESGNPVVAVEPNAEMRVVCGGLQERWPKLTLVDGTAEATGLPANAIEMVAAGRAFHWFEPVAAAAEFRRVLVPGGWVVLVANGRRKGETAQEQELEQLLMEYGTDYAYVRDRWGREERMIEFFADLAGASRQAPMRAEFSEERHLGWDAFAGLVQSMSCAPLPCDARYAAMRRALAAYFARWNKGGLIAIAEACYVNAGRVSS